MSRDQSLRKLEQVLESFLDRAVALKENRLQVLGGIDRLDDIARGLSGGDDLSEDVGNWFAEHNRWLTDDVLRPADRNRIGEILTHIQHDISPEDDSATAAMTKIRSEIDRWSGAVSRGEAQPVTLKRGAETAGSAAEDSIGRFRTVFSRMENLLADMTAGKAHILSVLDEALKKADVQRDKEALILSGLIIYYLKQQRYKVEPYVRRLKEAERRQERSGRHA